jgi:hypothetical protein
MKPPNLPFSASNQIFDFFFGVSLVYHSAAFTIFSSDFFGMVIVFPLRVVDLNSSFHPL